MYNSDHLLGIYIYGALTVVMLFVASLVVVDGVALFLIILCSGCAYVASSAGYAGKNMVCNFFVVAAILTGLLSLVSIIT